MENKYVLIASYHSLCEVPKVFDTFEEAAKALKELKLIYFNRDKDRILTISDENLVYGHVVYKTGVCYYWKIYKVNKEGKFEEVEKKYWKEM